MTIDPLGRNAYGGLAVPLYGESILRQQNSSNTILTLMHSALNAGSYLMVMDYKADLEAPNPTSVLTDMALLDIDADGGLRALSGTTVLMELNSLGLYDGTTQILNSSGQVILRQPVVNVTTGEDYAITTAQTGTLFVCGTNNSSGQKVSLPINPTSGVWFDIYVSTQHTTADFNIVTTEDSSAKIFMPGMTSAVSTADNIAPLTTEGHNFVRLTALSSILWVAHTAPGYANAATTNFQVKELTAGHWHKGSTA